MKQPNRNTEDGGRATSLVCLKLIKEDRLQFLWEERGFCYSIMWSYLDWSNGRLGLKPLAPLVLPSSRKPLHQLRPFVDEAVPEYAHPALLLRRIILVFMDEKGTSAAAKTPPRDVVHGKTVGPPQKQDAVG